MFSSVLIPDHFILLLHSMLLWPPHALSFLLCCSRRYWLSTCAFGPPFIPLLLLRSCSNQACWWVGRTLSIVLLKVWYVAPSLFVHYSRTLPLHWFLIVTFRFISALFHAFCNLPNSLAHITTFSWRASLSRLINWIFSLKLMLSFCRNDSCCYRPSS